MFYCKIFTALPRLDSTPLQYSSSLTDCCQNSNVPEFCLGLCTPFNARSNIGSELNACSKFDAIIEKCFQPFVDSMIRDENQGKQRMIPKKPGDPEI